MDSVYQSVKKSLEQERPDLLRALNPRLYQGADQWESPVIPAVQLAAALDAFTDPLLAYLPETRGLFMQLISVTAAGLIEYGVPTYFAHRDLASAILHTEPPEDVRWTDVPLPFPAGLFMLPRGLVADSSGRPYNYVTWRRIVAGQPIKMPGGATLTFGNDALIFSSASIADPEFAGLTKTLDANTWPHVRLGESTRVQLIATLSDEEQSVINTLAHLALGLLLAFEARPSLYTPDRKLAKATRRARGGREVWTPRVLGANYHLPASSASQGGTHASPRLHWRRGHFRLQPFGPKRSERRLIWIEPMLVGAETED